MPGRGREARGKAGAPGAGSALARLPLAASKLASQLPPSKPKHLNSFTCNVIWVYVSDICIHVIHACVYQPFIIYTFRGIEIAKRHHLKSRLEFKKNSQNTFLNVHLSLSIDFYVILFFMESKAVGQLYRMYQSPDPPIASAPCGQLGL